VDDSQLTPGSKVNQYEIVRQEPSGAFGLVFQARDTASGRTVGLRAIDGALGDAATTDRVRRAADRLVRLRHHAILPVINYVENQDAFYLVTEDRPGICLEEHVVSSTPDAETALPILATIGEAIDFVHEQGLVHGESLAASVILQPGERPLLADAGLAPFLHPDPQRYLTDRDRRNLAALAYRLLTGAAPAGGRYAEPASSINPQLGTATDSVLSQGLISSPESGWPNCGDFIKALGAALEHDLQHPVPLARPPVTPARKKTHWAAILATIVILLVLAGLGYLAWLLTHPAQTASMTLSSSVTAAGRSVVINASHLPANQAGTVQIQSNSRQIGIFQADQAGNLSQSVVVPQDTSAGDHLISLCWSGNCPVNATLQVTAPPPTQRPQRSPRVSPSPVPTASPTASATPPTTPSQSASPAPSPSISASATPPVTPPTSTQPSPRGRISPK
jgi:serine/threonine protein kinase